MKLYEVLGAHILVDFLINPRDTTPIGTVYFTGADTNYTVGG